jgi:hypothetical protein
MPRTVWIKPRLEALVDLQAQPAHGDIDHVGIAVEVHVPHRGGDERARQDLAATAHEQLQQGIFLGRQLDASTAAQHATAQQVQLQIGHAQDGRLARRPAAPQQGPHPRQQLGEGKGLDQVVVGTELQSLHTVVHLVARREEQDRQIRILAPHAAEDLPAVQTRQHDVQDHQVIVPAGGQMQTVEAVARQVDDEARLGQSLAQIIARLGLVLDDQNPHRCPRRGCAGSGRGSRSVSGRSTGQKNDAFVMVRSG